MSGRGRRLARAGGVRGGDGRSGASGRAGRRPRATTGSRAWTTEFVAFLDSDCVPPPDWIERLAGHFDDPRVAAVAPRIRASDGGRSPLDMGPGRNVSYLPSAALIVRMAAQPWFDPALRYGEDVDLIWRLEAAGWRFRYEPDVVVAARRARPAQAAVLVRHVRRAALTPASRQAQARRAATVDGRDPAAPPPAEAGAARLRDPDGRGSRARCAARACPPGSRRCGRRARSCGRSRSSRGLPRRTAPGSCSATL